ncbi:MAG: glycosyltransferase [Ignavibacteriales bacterium]
MTIDTIKKFAILSHVLPPAPSGQAIVIYRLLIDLPNCKYCLISHKDKKSYNASEELPTNYHCIESLIQSKRRNLLVKFFKSYIEIFFRAIQVAKILQREKCTLLIACTGDIYDLSSAYLISKWIGIPYVVYIFDDYIYQWQGLKRKTAKWLEPKIIRNSKGVIVPNEYLQKEYLRRYGIDSTIIRNPCLIPDIGELDKATDVFSKKEINIVYTGAVYHVNFGAFKNLIKAINILQPMKIKLHVYTSQSKELLQQEGIIGDMVIYHEHINQAEIPKVLRKADLLFLPLAFDAVIPEVIKTSAPGKMGDYLSVGKPILAHVPEDSFLNWYFQENQCGIVVSENDPNVLSETLVKVISDKNLQQKLGEQAVRKAKEDFDVDKVRLEFIKFLGSIR